MISAVSSSRRSLAAVLAPPATPPTMSTFFPMKAPSYCFIINKGRTQVFMISLPEDSFFLRDFVTKKSLISSRETASRAES
jgi:hypothetical protein